MVAKDASRNLTKPLTQLNFHEKVKSLTSQITSMLSKLEKFEIKRDFRHAPR